MLLFVGLRTDPPRKEKKGTFSQEEGRELIRHDPTRGCGKNASPFNVIGSGFKAQRFKVYLIGIFS